MSGFIMNPEKLKKLPKELQKTIALLDTTQLSHIQAAFSNQIFFDFLGLPTELRRMIIRLILGDRTYRVKTPSDAPVGGLQLLLVNKAVCNEALSVLRETATCKLDFETPVRSKSKAALRLFRHFSVDILVRKPYFKWGNKTDRMRKIWSMMKDELLDGHDETDKHAHISLHLNFSVEHLKPYIQKASLDHFDPRQEYMFNGYWRADEKVKALFWKQQLKVFVTKAQEDLRLDFANGRITSNADVDWPEWRVWRKDENRVWCHKVAADTYQSVHATLGAWSPSEKSFSSGQYPSSLEWSTA